MEGNVDVGLGVEIFVGQEGLMTIRNNEAKMEMVV